MYVAKLKALISCTFIVQLICTFVFAYRYAKSRFSHDMAHFIPSTKLLDLLSVCEIYFHLIFSVYHGKTSLELIILHSLMYETNIRMHQSFVTIVPWGWG